MNELIIIIMEYRFPYSDYDIVIPKSDIVIKAFAYSTFVDLTADSSK